MTRVVLFVGNDHWGRRAANLASGCKDVAVTIDSGASVRRVLKLIRRGSLPVGAVTRMTLAELSRKKVVQPDAALVRNNRELIEIAREHRAAVVILYRAGLIVSREVMASLDVLNIHCASLKGYGGLASIPRALADAAYVQEATLHRVTSRIDEGEVLDTEPFSLDPTLPYRRNEDLAYDAGLRLLERTLKRLASSERSSS